MKRLILTLLATTLLCACAGSPFKWSQARQIKQGMTTSEVVSLIGKPTNITSRDGKVIYVWVHVNTFSGQSRSLRVDFANGKAISAPPIPDEFQD